MSLNLDKSTWKRVAFGDVVANINEYYNADVDGVLAYVAGPHINPGEATVANYGSTDEDQFPPTFKRKFQSGDVLLRSRGIEKLASADRAGVTGEKLFVLRSKDENSLLQPFLVWFLHNPDAQVHMRGNFTGSVNKFLNWKPLAAMELDLPPVDDQKRIADLLWAVQRHMSSVVEAKQLSAPAYDAWLVERLSRFATVPLGDVIELQHGRPVPSSLYGKGDFPLLRPGDMKADGSVTWSAASVKIPQAFASGNEHWILREGDLVINMTAQSLDDRFLGRVCRMHAAGLLNQRIGRLTTDERITDDFAFVALRSLEFAEWVVRRSEGSKVKHLHWRHIADYPLPCPALDVQAATVAESSLWSTATSALRVEATSLATIRSTLLAEVFGGR